MLVARKRAPRGAPVKSRTRGARYAAVVLLLAVGALAGAVVEV
jgi:hypothetical protein